MEKEKIALLIDADNANSNLIEQIINETGKYGQVTIRRIYADWTNVHNKNWKDKLNSFAIRPIQKFEYTKGKNSTDTALIIDAMDLLHSKIIDGFCIVSSDSDYTGLANRIREEGMTIIGIGKRQTPEAFKKACGSFILEENLSQEEKPIEEFNNYKLIEEAFDMVVSVNGLALLSRFSDALKKVDPEFDYRSFGYKNLTSFCKDLKGYDTYLHDDKTTMSLYKKDNNKRASKATKKKPKKSQEAEHE
ncbi:OST-HTH/LOTUS domain-containing protein [Capnocytophaga haemolytica]|jgi:hypothetical protein|uniref:NYN domain n=1 Tax=Capnocytophaga haemolytica TaxID=45243 RepID=A0AAX2GWY2_9FLAO|nr:NYN domain-containing protein [Capnocytophaga haemolytica]AMD84759.1 hypothetical protein AXF12_04030 [Capnocytophaga haemolytica]SFN73298.1 OST-HTH/LOTUS domain-containing protein [Capnocytophaga haemolytica]SNV07753.1 NYN domain [Capnocytophaga haemolytica]